MSASAQDKTDTEFWDRLQKQWEEVKEYDYFVAFIIIFLSAEKGFNMYCLLMKLPEV